MEGERREFVVPSEGIDRLDVWLTSQCEGFSRARVQGLMKAGMVTVNGTVAMRATIRTAPGDAVAVEIPPPVPAEPEPEAIPLDVIFEDDDIIAIDKPAGLVVHPAPGHLTGTLVNALLHHCPSLGGIGGVARPGIVHRLDQDTSGVMVAAKSQRAMDALVRAFSSHTAISKTYLAVVHGVPSPPEGRLENLIGRCPFDRKKMAVVERNGKNAVTLYKVLGTNPLPDAAQPLTLVECAILTGRTHQIRVHMASSLGSPIAGDAVYGRPGWDKRLSPRPMRQLLHARRLSLAHPVTRQPLVLEAPLPADFRPYLPAEF
jgi:23S rRNA pseudouridine1911/1915/1917 synthase